MSGTTIKRVPSKAALVRERTVKSKTATVTELRVKREAREALTPAQTTQLAALERTIAADGRTVVEKFVAMGDALRQINTDRLYRGEYKTFDEYCAKRWRFSRQQAYRLMTGAKVQAVLTPIGVTLPNEAVARELGVLADKPRLLKAVVQELSEAPTAKEVKEAVAQHLPSKRPKTKRLPSTPNTQLTNKDFMKVTWKWLERQAKELGDVLTLCMLERDLPARSTWRALFNLVDARLKRAKQRERRYLATHRVVVQGDQIVVRKK